MNSDRAFMPPEEPERSRRELPSRGVKQMSKLQALVIDDEPQVRNFVAEVLRDDNWTVDEADSAERAFELLRERRYTLVFCDVMFSGTADGFTVLRRLTQEQPEAHIVLMTGYGSAAGALDATAFGALDYLLKPFSFAEVQDVADAVRRQVEKQPRPHADAERAAYVHTSDLNLIGRSGAFVKVMKLVGRLA